MLWTLLYCCQHIYTYNRVFLSYAPQIYPVWLCPFKLPKEPGMLRSPSGKQELYVDIGTYGVPKVSNFHPVETTRRVESFVRNVKGYILNIFLSCTNCSFTSCFFVWSDSRCFMPILTWLKRNSIPCLITPFTIKCGRNMIVTRLSLVSMVKFPVQLEISTCRLFILPLRLWVLVLLYSWFQSFVLDGNFTYSISRIYNLCQVYFNVAYSCKNTPQARKNLP